MIMVKWMLAVCCHLGIKPAYKSCLVSAERGNTVRHGVEELLLLLEYVRFGKYIGAH